MHGLRKYLSTFINLSPIVNRSHSNTDIETTIQLLLALSQKTFTTDSSEAEYWQIKKEKCVTIFLFSIKIQCQNININLNGAAFFLSGNASSYEHRHL